MGRKSKSRYNKSNSKPSPPSANAATSSASASVSSTSTEITPPTTRIETSKAVSAFVSTIPNAPPGTTTKSATSSSTLSSSSSLLRTATFGQKSSDEINSGMVERLMEESLQRGNTSHHMFSSSSYGSSAYLDGIDDDDDDDGSDDYGYGADGGAQKTQDLSSAALVSPATMAATATLSGGDLLDILRSYKSESAIRYEAGLEFIRQGKVLQGMSYVGEAILLNERVISSLSKEIIVAVCSNRLAIPKDFQPLQKATPEQHQSPQDEAFSLARRPRTTPEILARVAQQSQQQQQQQSQQKSSRARNLQPHPPLRSLLFRAVLHGYFDYKNKDNLSAVKCFSELILCCRDGSPFVTYRGRLHELRALCYVRLKDFAKARRDLCASFSLDSAPQTRLMRGKLYFHVGHSCGWRDETIADFLAFIEYSADNPFECKDRADAHVYLSVIYGENTKLRDLAAGLRHYRRGMVEIRKWMIISGATATADVVTVMSRDPVYKKASELYKGFHPCEVCQMPSRMVCAKCREAWYCSRECQMTDWKANDHKEKCQDMLRKRLERKEMIKATKEEVAKSSATQKPQKQHSDDNNPQHKSEKTDKPTSSSSSNNNNNSNSGKTQKK